MDKENSGLNQESKKRLQEFLKRNGFNILHELIEDSSTNSEVIKDGEININSSEGEAKKASPKLVIDETKKKSESLERVKKFLVDRGIDSLLEKIASSDEEKILPNTIDNEEVAEEARITAIVNQIQESLEKQFALEDEKKRFKELVKKGEKISRDTTKKVKKKIKSFRGRTDKKESNKPQRLTEPKKRNILGRTINRKKYNLGWMDFLEDAYINGEITQEEVDESKNGETWRERRLYKKVQAYEDAVEDLSIEKGWLAFKIGLITVLLAISLYTLDKTTEEFNRWHEESHRVVTIENAREDERTAAMSRLLQIYENTDYEFANLTDKQMLDAALRIPVIERKINEGIYKGYMNRMQDQDLLTRILEDTYEDEMKNFSPAQIRDLKQLAYEFLDKDIKEKYMRDPQVVDALAAKRSGENREIGD